MRLSFITSLKACAKKKDLYQGSKIHADILATGLLEKDTYLGSTLVSMYAKCGALVRAQQVVDDELPVRDVTCWTALIAGYVQHGQGTEALVCFHQMQRDGLSPNAFTYACILKACGIMQDVVMGKQMHDEIENRGFLKNDVVLGGALVDMYAKCGVPLKAQKVFDELPVRDVVSWTALIAGYARHGRGQKALDCFQRMRSEGFSPNAITYACILKACCIMQDTNVGKQIHDEIVGQGLLKKNVVLGNVLVDMYAKCGVLRKAQEVLDELPARDVFSWNALIAGYAQQKQGKEALGCFHEMQREGFTPDAVTYTCLLKVCSVLQDSDMGKKIHDEIASQGLLKKDDVLRGALVDMYAKCGVPFKAQKDFDQLPSQDVISWTVLIAQHAQQGQGQKALGCFQQMRSEGFSPNAITYAYILKACGIVQDIEAGKQIHDEIVSQGLLKKNVVLGNALVDMYVKCGVLWKAQEVLDKLPAHDAISWNALIAGYAQHGRGQEAMGCFHKMRREGFTPDAVTYACILKVCGMMQDVDMGKQIHDEIINRWLLEKDIVLCGALIDMYAKCGILLKAQQVFDELPVRDAVSWNALIAGYGQQGHGQEALSCFHQMQREGFSPDAVTYSCILKVCGIMKDIDMGGQIHDEIVSQGLLKKDDMLCRALVDMYAKCGVLLKAQKVFDELPVQDAVSWTALLAGYAQQGQGCEALGCFLQMRSKGFSPDVVSWTAIIGAYAQQGLAKEALDCFQEMQQEGISPNAITFVNMLKACSHAGLVVEGQMYFDTMKKNYGITPNDEHYTCMVDLFGRARLFDKAMRVIAMVPSSDHPPVWFALLGACRKWGNVKLGRFAFEHAIQLDQCNAAAYVLMRNIYAAAGMEEEAENIEQIRIENATQKQSGCDVTARLMRTKFVVGDTN